MRYVTREHIHVDRIATAWAIRRFVDSDAAFSFVPRSADVSGVDGITFDLRGAQLGHRRGRCTLDALIEKYELADEALGRMAAIVRGADLPQEDATPSESPGVLAVFTGIRDTCDTDAERLERGSIVCDALYAYCVQTKMAGRPLWGEPWTAGRNPVRVTAMEDAHEVGHPRTSENGPDRLPLADSTVHRPRGRDPLRPR